MAKTFAFEAVGRDARDPNQRRYADLERVSVWTDGLMLSSEHEPGWPAAYRLRIGRKYRITVEDITEPEGGGR